MDPSKDLGIRALAERVRREKARRHMLDWCTYSWPGFLTTPHRELITDVLTRARNREYTRVMIFVPPQYGKSECVSRRLAPWWLGNSPDESVVLTSYAASLAHEFSRQARNLCKSAAFHACFGVLTDSTTPVMIAPDMGGVMEWRLAYHRGGLVSNGVGGGITGKTAHLAIIDDPVKDDAEAQSETYRRTAQEWYASTLYTRVQPKGVIVICQTRWHEDDLSGWLLKQQDQGGDEWHVLRMPAMAEDDDTRRSWLDKNYVKDSHYLVSRPGPDGRLQAIPWADHDQYVPSQPPAVLDLQPV